MELLKRFKTYQWETNGTYQWETLVQDDGETQWRLHDRYLIITQTRSMRKRTCFGGRNDANNNNDRNLCMPYTYSKRIRRRTYT